MACCGGCKDLTPEALHRLMVKYEITSWAAYRWSWLAENGHGAGPIGEPLRLIPLIFDLMGLVRRAFRTPEEAADFLQNRPAFRFRSWRLWIALECFWNDDPALFKGYAYALLEETRRLDILTLQSLWRESVIYSSGTDNHSGPVNSRESM